MTDLLLHKLNKYQIKLEQNPENSIYQNKVNYYTDLIGGWPWDNKIYYNFNSNLLETGHTNPKKIEIKIKSKRTNIISLSSIRLPKGIKEWSNKKISVDDIFYSNHNNNTFKITDINHVTYNLTNTYSIKITFNMNNFNTSDTIELNEFLLNYKPSK